MTEKKLNILLAAATILVISFGCFFYLRPVSYRSYQSSIPSAEEPSDTNVPLSNGSVDQPENSTATSTATSTTPEQKETVEKDAETTTETASREEIGASQACLISGGRIAASLCCKSAGDFPNSCLVGACGCSSDNSKAIMICECGEGKCFDGTECVSLEK